MKLNSINQTVVCAEDKMAILRKWR